MSNDSTFSTDYLIVGQGLAGTLVTYFLLKAGRSVHVIDDGYPRAATKVAAGIINPVTGRRYVKSWRIDELIPQARQTYRELENLLDIEVYHPRSILRALFNAREENDWQTRAYTPEYQNYIVPNNEVDTGAFAKFAVPAFDYGELREGAQVEIGKLVKHYRQYLQKKNRLSEAEFDFSKLKLSAGGINYKGINAQGIIFCEGAKAKYNPFFSYLPHEGNKGETLIAEIPGADFQKILKQRIFIVPLAGGQYWIGSTSDNHHSDDLPSTKARDNLLEKLNKLLLTPFELKAHQAAIRPTVKDRRPLLGKHPDHPQLIIFNGLGTKGASLGPYWAAHLSEVLNTGQKIDPEVNINRFELKASK